VRKALVIAFCLLVSGCATAGTVIRDSGPTLSDQINTLRSHLHAAKSLGAMVCDPGSYARVQASYRFATLEKGQGNRVRAREHVEAGLALSPSVLDAAKDCPVRGLLADDPEADPWLDGDGDGLGMLDDRCPYALEDIDGFEDENGCPDPDNDGDGTLDGDDRCPDGAEDHDGYEDEDGCPDPDNDADGIADVDDSCPDEGESINRYQDEDGCPDVRPKVLKVTKGYIQMESPVLFVDAQSAELLATSFPVLEELAQQLKVRPDWIVRIEGHTSNRGKAEELVLRSQARAEAVANFLVAQGLSKASVLSQGYGGTKPKTTNRTKSGRAQNERVDVALLQGKGALKRP